MAWSVLQTSTVGSGFGTAVVTATYPNNVSAGTKLICYATTDNNGNAISSVKDNNGNSFTQIVVELQGGSNGSASIWVLDTPAGDVGTKPTITVTTASSHPSCIIHEVSGLVAGNTSAILDGTAGVSNGTTSGTIGPPTYGSTASNEFLVYMYGDDGPGSGTVSGPSGYTLDPNGNQGSGNSDTDLAYKNSTGGTETGTWTTTGGGAYALILVAFKVQGIVYFDAVGPSASGTASTTSPLTWTHICGTAANLILVTIADGGQSGPSSFTDITAVSYGGNACSVVPGAQEFSNSAGPGAYVQIWYLFNPPTGSNTVSVSSAAGNDIIAGSLSFVGASSFGAASVKGTNGTAASSISTIVTNTVTGGMVAVLTDYGGGGGGGTFSGTNSVTVQWQKSVSGGTAGDNGAAGTVISTGNGASQTVGMSNNAGTDLWGIVAVEVRPTGPASSISLPVEAKFPPTWWISRHHPGKKQHWLPQQTRFIPFTNTAQQYTETLAAVVAAVDRIQNQIGQHDVTIVTVSSPSPQRLISKTVSTVSAVVSNVSRQITRSFAAVIAAASVLMRQVKPVLTTVAAATATIATVRQRIASLVTSLVATASTQRTIGRILAATSAVTAGLGRQIFRVLATVIAVVAGQSRVIARTLTTTFVSAATLSLIKVKQITLSALTVAAANLTRMTGRPLQASTVTAPNVTRSVSKTYSTVTAATGLITRTISRPLQAVSAITGKLASSIGKPLQAPVVAVSTLGRSVNRVLQTVLAMSPALTRVINRTVQTVTALTATVNPGRSALTITLAATAAVASAITRATGKPLSAVSAVDASLSSQIALHLKTVAVATSLLTRNVTRTLSAVIVSTVTQSQIKVRTIVLAATAVVASNITRKIQPTLSASLIIVSGTTRTIFRPIQGNLVIAGQTARTIGRVIKGTVAAFSTQTALRVHIIAVSTLMSVSGTVKRSIGATQSATVTVNAAVTRRISRLISAVTATLSNIIAGHPHILVLVTTVSSSGSVVAHLVQSGFTIIFKYGLITGRWITGGIRSRWKTGP